MDLGLLLASLCAMLVGTALGSLTGLVPGVHVNTMALLLLLSYPSLLIFFVPVCGDIGLSPASLPTLLACVIVSAAVTHSFLDFLPSVFIGVPDEEDCLSVLPGHRLLLAGKGLMAVRLAAEGSLGGAMTALLLSIPLLLLFNGDMDPLERMEGYVPGLLVLLLLFIILSQRQERQVRATFHVRSYVPATGTSIVPVRPMPGAESVIHGRAHRQWPNYRIETLQGSFRGRCRGRLPEGPLVLHGLWTLDRRRWTAVAQASGVVGLSGMLGIAVLWGHLPTVASPGLDGNMMFPLLTGLFGVPSLLSSQGRRSIPVQDREARMPLELGPVLGGSLSGLLAGLVPGVTSTSATVTVSLARNDDRKDEDASAGAFIATNAAVGTAAMVFGVLALASTGHGGTGALMVVESMLGDATIATMDRPTSAHLALLLLSVLLSSLIAFVLTIKVGAIVAKRSSGSGGRLSRPILVFVILLCLVICGPAGLIVLTVSTLVGCLPPALGVSRVCLTGCLILPILMAMNDWQTAIESALELVP